MSEMIERVARAIFNVNFSHYPPDLRERCWPAGRSISIEIAREAIKAMREPTEAMMIAACHAGNADMEASWRAAVDEALK